ncbi:molecular chaperone MKKS-like [Ptychodera flava]|uniref:molecular chaperone MKKS-like n=1 Tax=Ptychodera flava TaxID=63121 RepID=UPI00396A2499
MSGDSDEFMDIQYVSSMATKSSDVVLPKIVSVVEDLVQQDVGLVACQKVIHPTVKKYLRECDVLTIDRLSVSHIDAVQKCTGAKKLSTFHSQVSDDDFGYLSDVTHKVLFGKSFIHMLSPSTNVVTLVICNHNESSVDELKNVCENAHVVLRNILVNPVVLRGGGEIERELVRYLREQIDTVSCSVLESLGIYRSHFLIGANAFVECLQIIAGKLDISNASGMEADRSQHETHK